MIKKKKYSNVKIIWITSLEFSKLKNIFCYRMSNWLIHWSPHTHTHARTISLSRFKLFTLVDLNHVDRITNALSFWQRMSTQPTIFGSVFNFKKEIIHTHKKRTKQKGMIHSWTIVLFFFKNMLGSLIQNCQNFVVESNDIDSVHTEMGIEI